MASYEDLGIWQQAHRLHLDVSAVCRKLPREDRYVVGTQLWRALSVPNNIVEGYGLGSDRLFYRHLRIAQGSLSEIRYLLLVLRDLKLMDEEAYATMVEQADRLGRSLTAFRQAVKDRLSSRSQSPVPNPECPVPTP
jgi:four helix bundle protein